MTPGAPSPTIKVAVGGILQERPDLRVFSSKSLDETYGAKIEKVVIPYSPRPVFRPYHNRTQRFAINVAHRRAGKTVAEINDKGRRLLTNPRVFPPPQGAFISPTFAQGKRNAWPYAKAYFGRIPGVHILEGDLTIVFPNRARFIFAGSDNYESLRGLYLDEATLDEYGMQDPRVWGEVVRPALSDYGGSATFIGSAKGRNHFYDLLEQHREDPDWYISILKASETGILSKEELEAARSTMTPEQYAQEYECSFDAAITGTFYSSDIELAETEGRITGVPYDKAALVYCSWDLGIGNAMALWLFQLVGKEYHFLYYYENDGKGLDHYLDWLKGLPFTVDLHLLPHDAKARELQSGRTRQQFFEGHNLKVEVLKRERIEDGIHAVKMVLNKCWFDRKNTKRGVEALRMYRTAHNLKLNSFSNTPLHDKSSNGADSFRTAAMGVREFIRKPIEDRNREGSPNGWLG